MIAAGQVRQDGQWAFWDVHDPEHALIIHLADDGMDVLFVCPVDGCGRRVVARRSGELIVLDKGDFYALHVGGTSGLEISPAVPGDQQAST
jgi:hypothetical protein